MVVGVAVINQNLFRFQQNSHSLLQSGVLPGAPFFVVAKIQVRMLYAATFLEQLIGQHVRWFVGLLGFVHQHFPSLPIPAGSAALHDVSKHALQRRQVSVFGVLKDITQP